MTKALKFLGIIILYVITLESASAQSEKVSNDSNEGPVYLYGSFQHVVLPGHWHINYYGISAEDRALEVLGLSGSILYGQGSNNTSFIHIPVTGLAAFILAFVFDPNVENLLLLFLEKVQYNYSLKDGIFFSPYWSILSADLAVGEDGKEGYALCSSGIGVNSKILISNRIVLSSTLGFKYFIVGDKELFGSGHQFGFTAGINLGYTF